MKMLKKPEIIHQVYNDGVIVFKVKETQYDEFGTPLTDEPIETKVSAWWFRRLGKTNEDVFVALSDSKRLSEKVAIRGNVPINIKWSAEISGKAFEVFRDYYNPKRNETEISLVEVEL